MNSNFKTVTEEYSPFHKSNDWEAADSSSLPGRFRRVSRSGFTLIELLVVIAIIAILAALLLPAVRSTMDFAQNAECMSKQKQISLAANNHMSDRDGRYPLAGLGWGVSAWTPEGLNDPNERYWLYYTDSGTRRPAPMLAQLGQYMDMEFRTDSRSNMEEDIAREKVEQHFRCPSMGVRPEPGKIMHGAFGGWRDGILESSNFGFSEGILGFRGATSHSTAQEYPAARASKVKRPSQTLFAIDSEDPADVASDSMVFFDVNINHDDHATMYEYYYVNNLQNNNWGTFFALERHPGGANAVFADGHVETIPMTDEQGNLYVEKWEEIYVVY